MKGIKKGLLAGMILCCMPMLTACSFRETLKILWNSEEKPSGEETAKLSNTKMKAANIDTNVEVPTIGEGLGDPATYGLNGEAEPIVVEASVDDGGTLSYQWYRNNVDSNGGGTIIEGAVENSYIPPTSEAGTSYYYVVVTNTIGEGIQMQTSATKCITVTEEPAEVIAPEEGSESADAEGTWIRNENGGQFMYADGTLATAKWEQIEGESYVFDENGYVRTGWYQEGPNWYYLNELGALVRDADVDGYHLGPDGVRQ